MKTRTDWRGVAAAFCVAFVVAFAISTGACAKQRHIAVVADAALYEALADAHAVEQQALCGRNSCTGVPPAPTVPGWTLEKSQAFNKALLPAVEGGRDFNRLLRDWKPGTPAPEQVVKSVIGITGALKAVAADFPQSDKRDALLQKLSTAQSLMLEAFTAYLALKGVA